ncbi:MAG: adenine phosphoribosyltransferase [Bacteroidales bacterium]|nr:adenine phosphoribosyltransferase [Bacteroidales bacterium]MCI5483069.1 adenine phosphoribosyltransferase [Bacteroidales bacterium]MDD6752033.1 adenine phosphoribosyltransferase [Bacteroidales bacterium]MDY2877750.1 adenine phosphoribosyltransferase [Candidatus Cryptobacteroides sp.]
MSVESLKSKLRTVPDFPIPGILFWDVTTLFNDPEGLAETLDILYDMYKDKGITKVVGIESRGYVLGAALAARLGAGFVLARKKGKLPAETLSIEYSKEYGTDTVEIHSDALKADDVVLIHDDLIATGGTAAAIERLVRRFGVTKISVNFLIEIEELEGRKLFSPDVEVQSIIKV